MNVLIIGLGSIAKRHIQVLRELRSDVSFFALRSSKDAPSQEGVTDLYEFNALDVEPDFVIISNPTSAHFDSIAKVAHFGCPLFLEKPILESMEKAEELKKLIAEKKILTYVGCHLRFHPCLQYLRAHLETHDETINEINVYYGSNVAEWQPGKDYRKSFRIDPALGGGVHLELVHEIDYLYWIFGKPIASQKVLRNVSSLNIEAVDYANYVLEYPTFAVSVVLNYYRRDRKRTCEIVFEDRTLLVDIEHFRITEGDNVIFESSMTRHDTFVDQMKYFLDHIEARRRMMNSAEEAMEVLRIVLQ